MTIVDLESKKPDLADWKRAVMERDGHACVNCERVSNVAARFIVPPEVGGRIRISNGVTMCRECVILAEGSRVLPQKIDNKTPINFLISRELHESIEAYAKVSNFGNISALVRNMILAFITAPEQFEDLARWQDVGCGSTVKINGWVDGTHYDLFKRMCQERAISYTDAFKSLLLIAMDTGVKKDTGVNNNA